MRFYIQLLTIAFAAVAFTACSNPTQPDAPLIACTRSYTDVSAVQGESQHISICYDKCPDDMEAYAAAFGQMFSRSAHC